jgi:hypothetical protein
MLFGFLFSIFALNSASETVQIPHGGILNHADASVTNSIAWVFEQYGVDQVYELTSDACYTIGSPLVLPSGSTLIGGNVAATVRAGSGMDNQTMIWMDDCSAVRNITVDANRIAAVGIDSQYTIGTTIENCRVINTKNNYSSAVYASMDSHLINVSGATNAVITGCTLKNAGCNPIENWGDWGAATNNYANGICAGRAMNVLIDDCVIDQTLGGSIAIARAEGVIIQGCDLSNSARINLENDHVSSQDSIIGYHNTGAALRNALICNNTITEYMNHGIHLSGERLILTNNTIHSGWHNAIRLDDQRLPTEYVVDALVEGNTLGVGSQTNTSSRTYINHTQSETITAGTNTRYEDGLSFVPNVGSLTSNVYSRYETFNDGNFDGWTVNYGSWRVVDKSLQQSMISGTRTITWDDALVTNGTLQVYLRQESGSGWSGIQFRKTNASDSPYQSGYLVFVRANGELTLYKAGVGALETVSSGMDPQDLFFLRLTVELDGDDIKVYLNGQLLISQSDSTYSSGLVGLASLGTVSRFDSVGMKP